MIPDEYYYVKTHECLTVDNDIATVCLTPYAVEQLGDITYVQLPELNINLEQGEVFGEVESVKTVSELYAPVGGRVIEINEELDAKPELINEDNYSQGWLFRMRVADPEEIQNCMTAKEYKEYIEQLDLV